MERVVQGLRSAGVPTVRDRFLHTLTLPSAYPSSPWRSGPWSRKGYLRRLGMPAMSWRKSKSVVYRWNSIASRRGNMLEVVTVLTVDKGCWRCIKDVDYWRLRGQLNYPIQGPQWYLIHCKEKERIRLTMHRCIRMTIRLMITGTDIKTMKELTMNEAMTTSREYSSHSSMALIESSHATYTVFHPLQKR